MGEIKFRFWNKELKRMSKIYGLGIIWESLVIEWGVFEWKNIDSLQYTGLKDSKGKEIYEEDILKGNGGAEDFFFDIGFEEGCFIAKMPWIKNGEIYPELKAYCGFKEDFISIEVIGNIYENPELLEP